MRRRTTALALGLCGAQLFGCAHAEAGGAAAPEAPAAAAPAPESKAPETTLHVSAAPIEALRTPYFVALELTFENPSSAWHEVRKVTISSERQLLGPALETLEGGRLRAWQAAAREAHRGNDKPLHPLLETPAPDAPTAAEAGAASATPPHHWLGNAFMVAPGLLARKWVVLYSPAQDALLGQDLLLTYELEDGKAERLLVQYPKPAPPK